MIELLIILILLFISNCADSMRDKIMPTLYNEDSIYSYKKKFLWWTWSPEQIFWHEAKWLSVFTAWGYMSYRIVELSYGLQNIISYIILIIFALICRWSWRRIQRN